MTMPLRIRTGPGQSPRGKTTDGSRLALTFCGIGMVLLVRHLLWLWLGFDRPYIMLYPAVAIIALSLGPAEGLVATATGATYQLLRLAYYDQWRDPAQTVAVVVYVGMSVLLCALVGAKTRESSVDMTAMLRELDESEERYRLLLEGISDYAVCMTDPDGIVISWSPAAERIKGWAAHEIIGRPLAALYSEEARAAGLPKADLAVAARIGEFREHGPRQRKDGSLFEADVTITAIRGADGKLRGFSKITRDVSALAQARRESDEHRVRLEGIVGSAMDAIITVDEDQRVVLFNHAAEAMFGHPVHAVLGRRIDMLLPERFRERHRGHIEGFGSTGVTSRAMGKFGAQWGLRADGSEFPIEVSLSLAENASRKLYTVILRDITDRVRAQEQQGLLQGELVHRVKNTLAVAQALAGQTWRFSPGAAFWPNFSARLAALGAAHDLLTRTVWEGADLADTIVQAVAPWRSGTAGESAGERIAVAGPAVWLGANEAVTLSLVFHELGANAIQHGALAGEDGRVAVDWAFEPGPAGERLVLRWIESGGPAVAPPSHTGFGTRLLNTAVERELDGKASLSYDPQGFLCILSLPLNDRVKATR